MWIYDVITYLNFICFPTIERHVTTTFQRSILMAKDQDVSLALLLKETKVPDENPPVRLGHHLPSHLPTREIKPRLISERSKC